MRVCVRVCVCVCVCACVCVFEAFYSAFISDCFSSTEIFQTQTHAHAHTHTHAHHTHTHTRCLNLQRRYFKKTSLSLSSLSLSTFSSNFIFSPSSFPQCKPMVFKRLSLSLPFPPSSQSLSSLKIVLSNLIGSNALQAQ